MLILVGVRFMTEVLDVDINDIRIIDSQAPAQFFIVASKGKQETAVSKPT